MATKISKILVSQPRPAIPEKSPYNELIAKYKVEVDYKPLIKVTGVTPKEFRSQRVDILAHTCVIFSSRTLVDSFFQICSSTRITVPETMKYICTTEAIALYLQKYIVYRKRKISFADGSVTGLIELVVKHKDEKFLLALSEPHKPEIPDALHRLRIAYTPVILARTVATEVTADEIVGYDMVLLYSPWDVKVLKQKEIPAEKLPCIATFGEGTLRLASEEGFEVKAHAPSPQAPSLAKAVDTYIAKVRKGKAVEAVEVVEDTRKEELLRTLQTKLSRRTRVAQPSSRTATSKGSSSTKSSTPKSGGTTKTTTRKVTDKKEA